MSTAMSETVSDIMVEADLFAALERRAHGLSPSSMKREMFSIHNDGIVLPQKPVEIVSAISGKVVSYSPAGTSPRRCPRWTATATME